MFLTAHLRLSKSLKWRALKENVAVLLVSHRVTVNLWYICQISGSETPKLALAELCSARPKAWLFRVIQAPLELLVICRADTPFVSTTSL